MFQLLQCSILFLIWSHHDYLVLAAELEEKEAGGATTGGGLVPPAIYVFGDSLLDSGNNNLLPTLAKANYPPYGNNFKPRGPTGRFTNGRTVADFIAEFVGVPYPPPFVPRFTNSWLTGFNYASGSCGILRETGSNYGKCLNLEDQVNLFRLTVNVLISSNTLLDHHQKNTYLANSIFLISVGNNDYINNYFDPNFNSSKRYDPRQFAQLLIHEFSLKLQELYSLGARKVVVFEVGPVCCIPNMARRIKHVGHCVEDQNRVVSYYNYKLADMLQNLSLILPGSHFVLGRANQLGYDAILNPSKYGLVETSKPCCKALSNDTLSCIPGLPPCKNPNEYFFWDAYHLTEAAYSITASACINNSSVCTPLNINQLLQA